MKFLVEIEVQGPLAIALRRKDTVGACHLVERMVRDGFRASTWPSEEKETFLTIRAMEHVETPKVRVP